GALKFRRVPTLRPDSAHRETRSNRGYRCRGDTKRTTKTLLPARSEGCRSAAISRGFLAKRTLCGEGPQARMGATGRRHLRPIRGTSAARRTPAQGLRRNLYRGIDLPVRACL